jgi:hypothetical protein
MSENGPREGTRDLPRPGPEAGLRGLEEGSPAGIAYGSLSRSLRRRRSRLVELVKEGMPRSTLAEAYQAEHPLEPKVTADEVELAASEALTGRESPSGKTRSEVRPRARKRPSQS